MIDRTETVNRVKEWCREVGKIQLEKMDDEIEINTKTDLSDLVTEVDELSEDILINNLKEHYPGHTILSEESGIKEEDSDYTWIIDPLDGTNNYAHGFFIYGISIALQYQGELILGVVYIPVLDYMYWAVKDRGAYLNNKRLKISNADSIREAIVATGFPYDKANNKNNNVDKLTKLIPMVRGIRRSGSAAFDLCNVAAGVFDGYWEIKLKIWDIAAGVLLVQEAGGKVILSQSGLKVDIIAGNETISGILKDEIGWN